MRELENLVVGDSNIDIEDMVDFNCEVNYSFSLSFLLISIRKRVTTKEILSWNLIQPSYNHCIHDRKWFQDHLSGHA
jgi:hypothetical protein